MAWIASPFLHLLRDNGIGEKIVSATRGEDVPPGSHGSGMVRSITLVFLTVLPRIFI